MTISAYGGCENQWFSVASLRSQIVTLELEEVAVTDFSGGRSCAAGSMLFRRVKWGKS